MKKNIPTPVLAALGAVLVIVLIVMIAVNARHGDPTAVKPNDYKFDPPKLNLSRVQK